MSGYSFPLAATTITDDFNRANETPIGAPWDTVTTWSSNPAALISNKFSAQDRGGFWDGGADYAGLWSDFEAVVTLGSDFSLLTNPELDLDVDAIPIASISTVALTPGRVDLNVTTGDAQYGTHLNVTVQIGDQIGVQQIANTVSGWYLSVSGGGWQFIGSATRRLAANMTVQLYCSADDGAVTADNFRIASVGQILPPSPPVGRGAAW